MYTFPSSTTSNNNDICGGESCPMHPKFDDDCPCYSTLEPTSSMIRISNNHYHRHTNCSFSAKKPTEKSSSSTSVFYKITDNQCTYCYAASLALVGIAVIVLICLTVNNLKIGGREQTRRSARDSDDWCLNSAVPCIFPMTLSRHLSPGHSIVISAEIPKSLNLSISVSSTQPAVFSIMGRNNKCPSLQSNEFRRIFDTREIGDRFHIAYEPALIKFNFEHEFSDGKWFLSISNTANESALLKMSIGEIREIEWDLGSNPRALPPPIPCQNRAELIDGECECPSGFNGRFCEIDGCKGNCGGAGVCSFNNLTKMWGCVCGRSYRGRYCQAKIELNCQDGEDDDGDGLVDCDDPDCCRHEDCINQEFCVTPTTPAATLISTNDYEGNSIYSKYKYSLSDQRLSDADSILDKRTSSLLVGNVYDGFGAPAIGVKVQIMNNPQYGYTYTNQNGFFSMMVNGGKSLVIWCDDPVSKQKIETFTWIPWSSIHRIPAITIPSSSEPNPIHHNNNDDDGSVDDFEFEIDRKNAGFQSYNEYFDLDNDNKILRLRIPIGNSGQNLVYTDTSMLKNDYKIDLVVTKQTIPAALTLVHLKVAANGMNNEIVFKARSNIKHSIILPFEDVMGLPVDGSFLFCVSVGYEFKDESVIRWKKKCSTVSPPIKRKLKWTIDTIHNVDLLRGLLHYGSGESVDVSQKLALIASQQSGRTISEADIHIQSSVPLPNGDILVLSDQSIYVIDHGMLNNHMRKIIEFRTNSQKRKITFDPVFGYAYVYDSDLNRILRIKSLYGAVDEFANIETALDLVNIGKSINENLSVLRGWVFDNQGILYCLMDNFLVKLDMRTGKVEKLCRFGNRRNIRSVCSNKLSSDNTLNLGAIMSITADRFTNSIFILSDQCVFKISNRTLKPYYGQCVWFCERKSSVDHSKLKRFVSIVFRESDVFLLTESGRRLLRLDRFKDSVEEIALTPKTVAAITATGQMREIDQISAHSAGILLIQDRFSQLFLLFHGPSVNLDHTINREFDLQINRDQSFIFNRLGDHIQTITHGLYTNISSLWIDPKGKRSIISSETSIISTTDYISLKHDSARRRTKLILSDLSNTQNRRSEIFTIVLSRDSNVRQILSDHCKYEFEYELGNLQQFKVHNGTHRRTIQVPSYALETIMN